MKKYITAGVVLALLVATFIVMGADQQESYTTEQTVSRTPESIRLEKKRGIFIDLNENTFEFAVMLRDAAGDRVPINVDGELLEFLEVKATRTQWKNALEALGSTNGIQEMVRWRRAAIKVGKSRLP